MPARMKSAPKDGQHDSKTGKGWGSRSLLGTDLGHTCRCLGAASKLRGTKPWRDAARDAEEQNTWPKSMNVARLQVRISSLNPARTVTSLTPLNYAGMWREMEAPWRAVQEQQTITPNNAVIKQIDGALLALSVVVLSS